MEPFEIDRPLFFYLGKPKEYWLRGVQKGGTSLMEAKDTLLSISDRIAFLTSLRERLAEEEKGKDNRLYFSTRNDIYFQLEALREMVRWQNNLVKVLENGGTLTNITDEHGRIYENVPDFRKIDASDILFEPETILTDSIPRYIPEIDIERLNRNEFVLDAIEISPDSFVLALRTYRSPYPHITLTGMYQSEGVVENDYVLLTLDQLVLTSDYYVSKQKAIYQDTANKQNERALKYWQEMSMASKLVYTKKMKYAYLSAKEKKRFSQAQFDAMTLEQRADEFPMVKTYGAKRIKLSDSSFMSKENQRTMPTSVHHMFEDFVDKTAVCTISTNSKGRKEKYGAREVFDYWYYLIDMLKWKIVDIRQQRTELSESRQSGMETSYGMTNTNAVLFESMGIYVKRQNGDTIIPQFIDQIRNTFTSVQSVFGGLRKFTALQPLIISHSANTYMYASTAIGVFISRWGSIGVSNKYGPSQFSDTMAHELAHYIDHMLGKRTGRRFLSDDHSSLPGKIGFTFREVMNKKTDSEYLNATKECFARAMQMHYAISTRGDDAEGVYDQAPPKEMTRYAVSEAFVSLSNYHLVIRPLIEQFFEQYADSFVSTGVEQPDPFTIIEEQQDSAKAKKLKLAKAYAYAAQARIRILKLAS